MLSRTDIAMSCLSLIRLCLTLRHAVTRNVTNCKIPRGQTNVSCVHFWGAYLCSPVSMFPNLYVPRSYVPQHLCSPLPMFPGIYVPPSYVPQYLWSPVSMLPGTYVPQYLCSPVSMFPGTYIPHKMNLAVSMIVW